MTDQLCIHIGTLERAVNVAYRQSGSLETVKSFVTSPNTFRICGSFESHILQLF